MILRKVWSKWKKIALTVARFQTKLLLTLFYFLVLSPLGGLFRLFGWDPLQAQSRCLKKASNWKPTDGRQPDLEKLRRQS
ncbi:MAG: hypothetical protein ABII79_10675 [bacterium]